MKASRIQTTSPPEWLHITQKLTASGEDDPIFSERLQRDGWNLKQEWRVENHGHPKWFVTSQPEIREKMSRNGKHVFRMTRSIKRLDYAEEFCVSDGKKDCEKSIPRASWADWDYRGRLVFLRDGKVFTADATEAKEGSWNETLLVDLNPSKPQQLVAPYQATIW